MATPYQDRPLKAPQLIEGDTEYYEACGQDRLLVKYCNDCGKYHHYPRPLCPMCFSDKTEFRAAKGTGTIHSFSITRATPVPYAIAFVTLDEGPSMMTNIVDCDLDTIRCDQRVTVCFKPTDDPKIKLPMFRPL